MPYDFCKCKPVLMQSTLGSFYRHNCFNFADLIDAAEQVRMITSVQLMRERVQAEKAQGSQEVQVQDLSKFFPFPDAQLSWPLSVNRTQGPDSLLA